MTVDGIMTRKRNAIREEFLKLTPFQRVCLMDEILFDIIAFKAESKGVSENEIYQEYLDARNRDRKRAAKIH